MSAKPVSAALGDVKMTYVLYTYADGALVAKQEILPLPHSAGFAYEKLVVTGPADTVVDSAKEAAVNKKKQPEAKKRVPLERSQRKVLTQWLLQHTEHPYPSNMTVLALASKTGLKEPQIKTWFINQRKRFNFNEKRVISGVPEHWSKDESDDVKEEMPVKPEGPSKRRRLGDVGPGAQVEAARPDAVEKVPMWLQEVARRPIEKVPITVTAALVQQAASLATSLAEIWNPASALKPGVTDSPFKCYDRRSECNEGFKTLPSAESLLGDVELLGIS